MVADKGATDSATGMLLRSPTQPSSLRSGLRGPRALLLVALAVLFAAGAGGQTRSGGPVLRVDIEGPIGPATARHIGKAVEAARERQAQALILRMNTPGGLVTSMREIVAQILSSPVPVIGYVAPPGAHAASAGTYILYATHVAAMAPGTNIGAATPVRIGGGGLPGLSPSKEDKDGKEGDAQKKEPQGGDALDSKATNDAVAFIRSLAELRGRNLDWAEKAVREAATLSALQAVELRVVDLLAKDQEELLNKLDGRTVDVAGSTRTLGTRDATVEVIEPGFVTRLLAILSNPNVAFILMLIGIYGLIFELATPGSIGPGLIGIICLVLALYALNQLPLDYAGVGLLMLGVTLMVIEALTPSFGVLGLAGLASFVIGATMLIDTDVPAFQLSWGVIIGTAAVTGALLVLLLGYIWRSQRRPATQRIPGSIAEVIDWQDGQGHVLLQGERWRARGSGSFVKGEQVRVAAMHGLTLDVVPLAAEEAAHRAQTEDLKAHGG